MSVRWLNFQNFQYSQELIASINTLLIHLRLEQLGNSDTERTSQADEARLRILKFLQSFEPIVSDLRGTESKPTLGTPTRIRQLAKQFVKATQNRRRFKSDLFESKFALIEGLLAKPNKDDGRILIPSLEDLRLLIEENLIEDTQEILGDVS